MRNSILTLAGAVVAIGLAGPAFAGVDCSNIQVTQSELDFYNQKTGGNLTLADLPATAPKNLGGINQVIRDLTPYNNVSQGGNALGFSTKASVQTVLGLCGVGSQK
jgi:hypothetical protein